jgi:competence protein ComEC
LVIGALLVANVFALPWAFPDRGLTVSFLNIGQGDSIFIESPTGVQMLVDGGPNTSVLRELGERLPFFDRSLDAVVETHPDKDHIAGLVDVLERYDVATFLEPGIPNDTSYSKALVAAVKKEPHVRDVLARRGMRLILGRGAYADILFPDRDVSGVETNTGSIVMHVVYGSTSFLLTGDSPQAIEKYLVSLNTGELASTVLKPGHHGSRTSSSPEYIAAVHPSYAVFSRGCDNSYGHPHKEVVDLLAAAHIPTLDTCKDGTVTFRSDGKTLRVER